MTSPLAAADLIAFLTWYTRQRIIGSITLRHLLAAATRCAAQAAPAGSRRDQETIGMTSRSLGKRAD